MSVFKIGPKYDAFQDNNPTETFINELFSLINVVFDVTN